MNYRPMTTVEATAFYTETSPISDKIQRLPQRKRNSNNPEFVRLHTELRAVWDKHGVERVGNDLVKRIFK